MIERIRLFVNSKGFQYGVLALIVAAGALVGLETSPSLTAKYDHIFDALNTIIVWAFVVEAGLKMAQYGSKFYKYFLDPWNVADFIITVICVLPLDIGFATVLRLARVIRALRLVTTIPRLQLIADSMIKSIPSMFYVGILLFLTFYIYGVMGVHLFGANDPVHFRDLPNAMLSLFRVVTLEEWTAIMDIQMLGSNVYPGFENITDIPTKPEARPYVAPLYFISFVFLGTMIMLNLFIGIIVGSMSEAQDESVKRHLKDMKDAGQERSYDDEFMAMDETLEGLKKQIHTMRLRLENKAEAEQADEASR
ncbi:MAG: ion transporter [Planctomycetia bacterium]|nr:ion transporter [Planctomycetia bacterium]